MVRDVEPGGEGGEDGPDRAYGNGPLPYPVLVRDGILEDVGSLTAKFAGAHSYAIISDTNVAPIYADRVRQSFGGARAELFTMPPGEAAKTVGSWQELSERILTAGFGRDTSVVALGGGIVGDVAGFVAATFMRGVPYVQIPTTVVAMVDSSIGGKTGVNATGGKNLIGAFHSPRAVISDPSVLRTLPGRELRAGMAEVLKHGIIADADYLAFVEAELPRILESGGGTGSMARIIERSVAIKARIVAADEREGGIRKVLNFGHTIGHALEALSGYSLLHGEAIAIGMCIEGRIAELAGLAESGLSAKIAQSLRAAALPTELPAGMSAEAVLQAAASDKKAREGKLELALPASLGRMAGEESGWALRVPRKLLLDALKS
jgi:3-dehydroquinate synthase